MSDKVWAVSVDGNTVSEVVILPDPLVPGQDVLNPAWHYTDVTGLTGVAAGWTKSNGTFIAPAPFMPTPAFLMAYANQKLASVLAAGKTFNVAVSGQPVLNILCDGTSTTRADLGLMGLFGQKSPTGTQVWVDNNGVMNTLTGTQIVTLVTEAGLWIASGYGVLGTILAAISATPPTITTTVQIDTVFAAF